MRNIMFAFLLLQGCVTTGNEVFDDSKFQVLPKPEIKMREVTWKVIQSDDNSYICVDPHNYSNLSLNVKDIMMLIEYQNKIKN